MRSQITLFRLGCDQLQSERFVLVFTVLGRDKIFELPGG